MYFIPMLFDILNTSSKKWDRFDHWCLLQPHFTEFFTTFISSISCNEKFWFLIHGTVSISNVLHCYLCGDYCRSRRGHQIYVGIVPHHPPTVKKDILVRNLLGNCTFRPERVVLVGTEGAAGTVCRFLVQLCCSSRE